ncbi:MAG: hypothetical protein M1536_07685 [Firmicutes bacterium]|nr:hypothetical protein [Bacillota bacterium]
MEDREFAVILEGIRSDFRVFKEGLDLVHQRLDSMEIRMDRLEMRMDKLEMRMDKLEMEIHSFTFEVREGNKVIHAILSDHEDKISSVEKKIA